ncbi:protein argonaute 14-like [Myotis myotis]|uniref:protein argonaute 14-like n=1 Tax=Myotis myotis TaxID=51298 RepID=UPI001748B04D|nr:protein argonaute 14-like [Myotis myotis]
MEVDATAADGPLTGRRRAAEREASPRGAGGAYLGRGRASAGAAGRADGGDGGGGSGGGRGLRSLLGIRRRRRRRRRQPGSALSSDAGGGAAHVRARAGRRFIWRSVRSRARPRNKARRGPTRVRGDTAGRLAPRPRPCPPAHLPRKPPSWARAEEELAGSLVAEPRAGAGAVSRENLARGRVLGESREGLLPNVSLAPPPAAVLLKAAVESAVMAAGRCHTVFFHTGPELRSGPRVPPMGKD